MDLEIHGLAGLPYSGVPESNDDLSWFFFSIFSGQSISHSLKHLAERRTDIFGVGEDAAKEAAIGNKMGEEETMRGREEKVN